MRSSASMSRPRSSFAAWAAPGRAWRWRVAGVTATGPRVEALGPSRCRVVLEVPLWAAPCAVVCRMALGRMARLVA